MGRITAHGAAADVLADPEVRRGFLGARRGHLAIVDREAG
jgi:hypothetical protein